MLILLHGLVATLENETGVALSWLKQNEMIANLDKFHAILFRKNQTCTSGEKINIDGKIIKYEETVKLLRITVDYRLILTLIFLISAQKLQHS